MIPVTKSFLPPIEEYTAQVQRAFDNGWLTNRGELVRELEGKLNGYLDIQESRILCTNNGTVPLQIALKLLGNGGEIITTPFSYVATTAAIVWENCTAVFVDIHPEYFTIDESKIEDAITDKTTCILATHVFGNACNVEEIERIALKHNLKVIYDAAHCFGVKYKGKSIFEYGDIITCSFHATKLFQTGEGGAAFIKNSELFEEFQYMHAFGHKYPYDFHGVGINGKMSELHAAMGLAVLPYIDEIINKRKDIHEVYKLHLPKRAQMIEIRPGVKWTYSYVPVLFRNTGEVDKVIAALTKAEIFPRKYFYPSLDQLPYIEQKENNNLEIAHSVASRVLCLPTYVGLSETEVIMICNIIQESTND